MDNRACFKRAGGAVPMHFKLSGDLNSRMLAVHAGFTADEGRFRTDGNREEVLRLEKAAERRAS